MGQAKRRRDNGFDAKKLNADMKAHVEAYIKTFSLSVIKQIKEEAKEDFNTFVCISMPSFEEVVTTFRPNEHLSEKTLSAIDRCFYDAIRAYKID